MIKWRVSGANIAAMTFTRSRSDNMLIRTPTGLVFKAEDLVAIEPKSERGMAMPFCVNVIVREQRLLAAKYDSSQKAKDYIQELMELWTNDKKRTQAGIPLTNEDSATGGIPNRTEGVEAVDRTEPKPWWEQPSGKQTRRIDSDKNRFG